VSAFAQNVTANRFCSVHNSQRFGAKRSPLAIFAYAFNGVTEHGKLFAASFAANESDTREAHIRYESIFK